MGEGKLKCVLKHDDVGKEVLYLETCALCGWISSIKATVAMRSGSVGN